MPKRVASFAYSARKRARYSVGNFVRPSRRVLKRSVRRKGYRFNTKTYAYHRYVSTFANVQRSTLPGNVGTNDPWIPTTNQFKIRDTTNAITEIDASFTPNFNDVKNVTEFTNLYDKYMITGVQYTFRLCNNPNSEHNMGANSAGTSTQVASNFYPDLWWCLDYDDSTIITKTQIQEYQNCRRRVLQPNRPVKIWLKAPRTRCALLDGSTLKSAGVNRAFQWVDMNQTTIDHFGLKLAICAPSPDVLMNVDFTVHVEAKYYFKCKDVR